MSYRDVLIFIAIAGVKWSCSSRKTDDTAQQIPGKYSDVENVRAYQENPEPEFHVSFEEDLTITPSESNNLYRIGGLGVDRWNRIFILDDDWRILDEEGAIIWTVRMGQKAVGAA